MVFKRVHQRGLFDRDAKIPHVTYGALGTILHVVDAELDLGLLGDQ